MVESDPPPNCMLFLAVALMVCCVVLVATVGRQGDYLVGVWGSGALPHLRVSISWLLLDKLKVSLVLGFDSKTKAETILDLALLHTLEAWPM